MPATKSLRFLFLILVLFLGIFSFNTKTSAEENILSNSKIANDQILAKDFESLRRTETSTRKIIQNDATGGACSSFGVWDQSSLTCTLTQDIFETPIEIGSDGITLDGNGHLVHWSGGYGMGDGIRVAFRKNITVKNVIVEGFNDSFGVFQTTNAKFLNNETRGPGGGFFLAHNDHDITIEGNKIIGSDGGTGRWTGIYI